jgi:hypothetical protein
MLADERDEKQLVARPKPTVEEDEEDNETEEDNSNNKAASEDGKGGKSPGDGASFQDVAL